MSGHDKIDSFGQFLSALMKEKGFKSDEQLARRAMLVQERLNPRINIQRRTINNWRNGKSKPRSIDDPQFKLVALALGLDEAALSRVSKYFENNVVNVGDDASGLSEQHVQFSQNNKARIWIVGVAIIFITVAGILTYNFVGENSNIVYVETIPPTQLRVSTEGFVLPLSDQQIISERNLDQLTSWELYVARNELFARKGRPFVKPTSMCLQNHFDSWAKDGPNQSGWYVKRSGDIQLSDLEYRNAEIIRNYECNVRGGQYNCNGKLNQCH